MVKIGRCAPHTFARSGASRCHRAVEKRRESGDRAAQIQKASAPSWEKERWREARRERGTLRQPSWPGLVASDRANSDDGEIDHGTAERKTKNRPVAIEFGSGKAELNEMSISLGGSSAAPLLIRRLANVHFRVFRASPNGSASIG
jgi:hypothetical protein